MVAKVSLQTVPDTGARSQFPGGFRPQANSCTFCRRNNYYCTTLSFFGPSSPSLFCRPSSWGRLFEETENRGLILVAGVTFFIFQFSHVAKAGAGVGRRLNEFDQRD